MYHLAEKNRVFSCIFGRSTSYKEDNFFRCPNNSGRQLHRNPATPGPLKVQTVLTRGQAG